jgi:hypothetical protein
MNVLTHGSFDIECQGCVHGIMNQLGHMMAPTDCLWDEDQEHHMFF